MFLLLFLIVPFCMGYIYPNRTDFSKCTVHYSRSDNSYKDFYEVIDENRDNNKTLLDFHFSVLAPSDAHILLSTIAKPNISDPVYEIVLGAGGNSFSDIRTARKASVRASISHPKGILSSLDFQSFWIHIGKDGLIEVGKEGEELAFIHWRDPNPLAIKFFSFGTWAGVEAKWFFDCPLGNTTGNSKDVKVLTNLERLREDLLSYYDPYVRPVLNHTDFTFITMKLLVHYVNLNEHKSFLNVEGKIQLDWMDEKTKWDPKKYGNITSLHLKGRQIWQPDLVLHNAVDLIENDFLGNTMMTVYSNGSVTWNPPAFIKVWCDATQLGHWPADNHSCEILLGFRADFNNIELNFDDINSEILETQKNSQWEVLEVVSLSNFGLNYNVDEKHHVDAPFLKLIFTLKRETDFYTAVFFAPILFVAISMLSTFWVSPFGPLKISLGCLQLIIASLVIINVGGLIPVHPKTVPYIVALYVVSLYASLFCISISIVVINLSREKHKESLPHCLAQTLKFVLVQKILLLPKVTLTKEYGKIDDGNGIKIDENVQNGWILLGIAIDRIAFAIVFISIIFLIFQKY